MDECLLLKGFTPKVIPFALVAVRSSKLKFRKRDFTPRARAKALVSNGGNESPVKGGLSVGQQTQIWNQLFGIVS
jgi:hypothetical protein